MSAAGPSVSYEQLVAALSAWRSAHATPVVAQPAMDGEPATDPGFIEEPTHEIGLDDIVASSPESDEP